MRALGLVAACAYIATIYAANYLVQHYGFVSVGFGLLAPAGVFAAGLAFTLRDVTHRILGVPYVLAAIALGGLVSLMVSPRLAAASAIAFTVSELLDLSVYTPLERRSFLGAVAASNTVGLVVDSMLFLWLAFGSLTYLSGQIVGKAWMTLAALAVLYPLRRVIPERAEA